MHGCDESEEMPVTTIAAASPPSPFAIFRNRSFALLWVGQVVETIGCSLTSLAASILVFRLTGSAASVGLMLMATSAPTILVGLLAGVVADRYDRKRIMFVADVLRAVLVLVIPLLIAQGIAWLYIIVALSAVVTQFFDPAHESVLPEIATDEELAAANSLMAISSFGATAVGFAASGLIASRLPIAWAFYLNAVAYVFSALMILAAPVPKLSAAQADSGLAAVGRNLRAGVRLLLDTPTLRSLFLVFGLVFVSFGLSNSLLLPFALKALGATEFQYGVQEGLTSVGFVIGSLWMARVGDRLREGQWIALALIGMALAGIGYASMPLVWPAIAVIALSGGMNAPLSIARRLITQRYTPRDMRGRVNSAFFVARDVLFLVGMGAAGLADVLPIRFMYVASALMLLAAGAWALVIPGLGQPAAEWKRALELLRRAPAQVAARVARPATLADFDALVALVPALGRLSAQERQALLISAEVSEASAGTTVVRHGDKADEVYFLLAGKAVAGVAADGSYRSLSTLVPGDFFGEIAALSGEPRTANVVAEEPATLLSVPAVILRGWLSHPSLRHLFLATASERLSRTHGADWPRLAGLDQQALRELREEHAPERQQA
jgi:CRP-like cAMP-binding protein/Na+/melibiose symporter-like transporter